MNISFLPISLPLDGVLIAAGWLTHEGTSEVSVGIALLAVLSMVASARLAMAPGKHRVRSVANHPTVYPPVPRLLQGGPSSAFWQRTFCPTDRGNAPMLDLGWTCQTQQAFNRDVIQSRRRLTCDVLGKNPSLR